uniref:Uncharacterized protein n=1 Tax=Oncorhynchus mykiss TaxID=8022 RepID=A0A8C7S4D8_ONCMY
ISLICKGPGPVWADGASMVTVRCGLATSGRSKGTGDRISVSVMFQKAFQKWTSSSGSMAYFPEVKKELAATPGERGKGERRYIFTSG